MIYPPLNEYALEGAISVGYVESAPGVSSPYAIIFTDGVNVWNCTKYPVNYSKPLKKISPDVRTGGGSRVKVASIAKEKVLKLDFELMTQAEGDGLMAFFNLVDGIQKQFTIIDNVLGGDELVTYQEAKLSVDTIEFDICKASISLLLVN